LIDWNVSSQEVRILLGYKVLHTPYFSHLCYLVTQKVSSLMDPKLPSLTHSTCVATRTIHLLFQNHHSKYLEVLSLSLGSICYNRKPSHIQIVNLSTYFFVTISHFSKNKTTNPIFSQLVLIVSTLRRKLSDGCHPTLSAPYDTLPE